MPAHIFVILPSPLLDDVVLSRVQIGPRWLCLKSVHFSQEVFIEFELADVFEESEVAGSGMIGGCLG